MAVADVAMWLAIKSQSRVSADSIGNGEDENELPAAAPERSDFRCNAKVLKFGGGLASEWGCRMRGWQWALVHASHAHAYRGDCHNSVRQTQHVTLSQQAPDFRLALRRIPHLDSLLPSPFFGLSCGLSGCRWIAWRIGRVPTAAFEMERRRGEEFYHFSSTAFMHRQRGVGEFLNHFKNFPAFGALILVKGHSTFCSPC